MDSRRDETPDRSNSPNAFEVVRSVYERASKALEVARIPDRIREVSGTTRGKLLALGFLATVGGLAALSRTGSESTENPNEVTKVEANEVPLIQKGDFEVITLSTMMHKVPEDGAGAKFLYNYLEQGLAKAMSTKDLSKRGEQNMVEALVELITQLNPEVKQVDQNWKGKTLKFPAEIRVTIDAPEGVLTTGYSRLQDAAVLDGFPVTDSKKIDEIYSNARNNGQSLLDDAPTYYRKPGNEESPNRMNPEAKADFEETCDRFFAKTGAKLSFTHVLRDRALMRKTEGSSDSSTHATGNSIDLADGRFQIQENGVWEEITWSEFDKKGKSLKKKTPYAQQIDGEFRPAIIEILKDQNAMVYEEDGHWHLYYPNKENPSINLEKAFSSDAPNSSEPRASKPAESVTLGKISISSILSKAIQKESEEKMDPEEAKQKLNGIVSEWIKGKAGRENYKHPVLTLLTHNSDQEPQRSQLVELISHMDAKTLVELEVFKGTTVHRDSTLVPPFSDMDAIWEYKFKHKSKTNDQNKFREAALNLANKEGEASMADILIAQAEAKATLEKYAKDFNRPDWAEFLSSDVNLAVMAAEFFSEFKDPIPAKSLIELMPTLVSKFNIAKGPAINDTHLSAGLVQMIQTTFDGLNTKYSKGLTKLGKKAPNKTEDPEGYLKTMIFDLKDQTLFGELCIIDHLRGAMDIVLTDANFSAKWDKASAGEKTVFLGTFAPLAINGGPGVAQKAARKILGTSQPSIHGYAEALASIDENDAKDGIGAFAARGAHVGGNIMEAFAEGSRVNLKNNGDAEPSSTNSSESPETGWSWRNLWPF